MEAVSAKPQRILVINAGSGSQRCSLFAVAPSALPAGPREPLWEGTLDSTEPGRPRGKLVIRVRRGARKTVADVIDESSSVRERTTHLVRALWDGPAASLSGPGEIDAIGHRVVHGGGEFGTAVPVTRATEEAIERLGAMAPLHNASNLCGIRVARRLVGGHAPSFAVFDTAYHRTLAPEASTYPGPREWLGQGLRRYGFHGTSFRWASAQAARLLGRVGDPELRLVICHLGGGCSLCATRGGVSVDTTMGFTPLDGIAMCTRSGSVDPGILVYLMRRGLSAGRIEKMLNKESGLKGLSGVSGDTRVLRPRMLAGEEGPRLAWGVFVHRLRAGIGQMLASLGAAPHALVFTDAISEDDPRMRADACSAFGFLGLELDPRRNTRSPVDADIATKASAVRVLIVKSREAWQIARECHELLNGGVPAAL